MVLYLLENGAQPGNGELLPIIQAVRREVVPRSPSDGGKDGGTSGWEIAKALVMGGADINGQVDTAPSSNSYYRPKVKLQFLRPLFFGQTHQGTALHLCVTVLRGQQRIDAIMALYELGADIQVRACGRACVRACGSPH